jgi:hypothetical protein
LNPTALNRASVSPHTFDVPTKLVLNLLALTGIAFAGGQTHAIINVSAVVRPAARIEVQSATSISIFATMYPNVEGLVWAAAGSCSSPENPGTFGASGRHQVSFSSEEVQGKNLVCFVSSDGLLHTSARLRQ